MFLAIALPVLATLIGGLATVDLTYLIRAGNEIFTTGVIPNADTWTFTAAGLPWVDQQWGAEVVLAAVFNVAGWTGLVLLRAVLVGIIFGCVYAICRRRGLPERTSALLTLVTFAVAAVALGLRAQAFGMAFFAVLLLLVTERRAHPRLLWVIPPLVLVWANVHGSFFLGPLVVGLTWFADVRGGPQPHRLWTARVNAASGSAGRFGDPFTGPVSWSSCRVTRLRSLAPLSTDRGVLHGCRLRYLRKGPRLRQVGVALPSPDQPSVGSEHPGGALHRPSRREQEARQRLHVLHQGRQGRARLSPPHHCEQLRRAFT